MLIIPQKNQRGASLVEILVGLAISMVVVIAVLGVFTSTFTASERVLEHGKLDRDLSSIMDIMVADIQRAGYWSNATNSGAANPFMTGTNDINTATPTCITFTYDSANDGIVDDTDKFGYRLTNGAIQFRPLGSTFDCAAGNWSNLSDLDAITVTTFNVTSTNVPISLSGSTSTINQRSVTITITGNLTTATDNVRTVTRTINVNNNKFIP